MPHPLPRFPICTYGHEGCDVRGHHLHPRRPDFDSRVRVNAWCDAVNETGTGDELAERAYQRLMDKRLGLHHRCCKSCGYPVAECLCKDGCAP